MARAGANGACRGLPGNSGRRLSQHRKNTHWRGKKACGAADQHEHVYQLRKHNLTGLTGAGRSQAESRCSENTGGCFSVRWPHWSGPGEGCSALISPLKLDVSDRKGDGRRGRVRERFGVLRFLKEQSSHFTPGERMRIKQ